MLTNSALGGICKNIQDLKKKPLFLTHCFKIQAIHILLFCWCLLSKPVEEHSQEKTLSTARQTFPLAMNPTERISGLMSP